MNRKILIACILLSSLIFRAQAHEGETHKSEPEVVSKALIVSDNQAKVFAEINEGYLANVKPIFQQSCFNCHSSQTNYPWYSKMPFAKQLIEADVTEAKKHLDFTDDFPFVSHSSPSEDLNAIAKSIKDGSMPPFRYRVMHPSSKLSSDEVLKVEKWVNEGLAKLKALTP